MTGVAIRKATSLELGGLPLSALRTGHSGVQRLSSESPQGDPLLLMVFGARPPSDLNWTLRCSRVGMDSTPNPEQQGRQGTGSGRWSGVRCSSRSVLGRGPKVNRCVRTQAGGGGLPLGQVWACPVGSGSAVLLTMGWDGSPGPADTFLCEEKENTADEEGEMFGRAGTWGGHRGQVCANKSELPLSRR